MAPNASMAFRATASDTEMLANVAGEEDGFATGFGNETFGLPGVRLFG